MAKPVIIFATARPPAALPIGLLDCGAHVEVRPLAPEQVFLEDAAVLVVDGVDEATRALWLTKTLRARCGDDCPPVVCLWAEPPRDTIRAFEHGADVVIDAGQDSHVLTAQLRAVLRWGETRIRVRGKAEELLSAHQQLQKANTLIQLDLDLARRLQAGFLPARLPEVGQVRFSAFYRPLGHVGGDFYDVFRLDERRVGFYLADAMGHGVPSSLLTVYLKKAVVAKEIIPGGYRLLPPDEVLDRLNRDLIAQNLAETPFVTMIYGLVDTFSGELSLARAAHPHPVMIPAAGKPRTWRLHGRPLGIFDSNFEIGQCMLSVGDRMLLTTDGLLAEHDDPAVDGTAALLKTVSELAGPADDFLRQVSQALAGGKSQKDDVTLLLLEFGG